MEMETVIGLLERSCTEFPRHPYVWEKEGEGYRSHTYQEVGQEAEAVAGGLLAEGLCRGDRVALLGEGGMDWICGEFGVFCAGGAVVPLGMNALPADLAFRIRHAEVRFIMVSARSLSRLEACGPLPDRVERVFVFPGGKCAGSRFLPFVRLKEEGREFVRRHPGLLGKRMAGTSGKDLAAITYTPGTASAARGVMLTHGNYVCNVRQTAGLMKLPHHYRMLLALPWDQGFAHMAGLLACMYCGASVTAVESSVTAGEFKENLIRDLQEFRPHVLLCVPALARRLRKDIEAGLDSGGRLYRRFYGLALKTGYAFSGEGNGRHSGGRLLSWPLYRLAGLLAFRTIRKGLGGRLRYLIGGESLLDKELQRYFHVLGMPLLQGYGLSEASPVVSSNTPSCSRFGTAGRPVGDLELKVCGGDGRFLAAEESGEILIRGGNVMQGYWKDEAATAAALRDGWLHTGDLGYLDKDGLLHVQGRKSSRLVAEDGETYSPEGIEEAVAERSPLIEHCLLYNSRSPYTAALVVLDRSAAVDFIRRRGEKPGSIQGFKQLQNRIYMEFMKYRLGGEFAGMFPERWLPAVIGILPEPLNCLDGTLNKDLKPVRRRVYEKWREELEYLYTPEGKDIRNVRNTGNLKRFMAAGEPCLQEIQKCKELKYAQENK